VPLRHRASFSYIDPYRFDIPLRAGTAGETVLTFVPPQPSEVKPVSPTPVRFVTAAAICLAVIGFATAPAVADKATKKNFTRDLSKNFDELTPSEQIAIRAAAKAAYKAKKLKTFNVCADPGNMPLSNIEGEGFQQKMAKVLADAMGARVTYSWRPPADFRFGHVRRDVRHAHQLRSAADDLPRL